MKIADRGGNRLEMGANFREDKLTSVVGVGKAKSGVGIGLMTGN
jgi:hypothetical protein